MQILASALPGFRDLRAPLTAGYLWLIFLWIVIKPDLATRPTNDIAGAIYDLGKHVGPIWLGLGVSVAAYLVGCVSQSISDAMSAAFDQITRESDERTRISSLTPTFPGQVTPTSLVIPSRLREIEKLQRDAIVKLTPYIASNGNKEMLRQMQRDVLTRAQDADKGLSFELNMPATLLIGKEPELFSEADRLKAESQLRFATVPPLIAILACLAVSQSFWWISGLIPIVILTFQGYAKNAEFQSLMLGAVQRGVIQSQSVEEFRFWVSALPSDGIPPRATPESRADT